MRHDLEGFLHPLREVVTEEAIKAVEQQVFRVPAERQHRDPILRGDRERQFPTKSGSVQELASELLLQLGVHCLERRPKLSSIWCWCHPSPSRTLVLPEGRRFD